MDGLAALWGTGKENSLFERHSISEFMWRNGGQKVKDIILILLSQIVQILLIAASQNQCGLSYILRMLKTFALNLLQLNKVVL